MPGENNNLRRQNGDGNMTMYLIIGALCCICVVCSSSFAMTMFPAYDSSMDEPTTVSYDTLAPDTSAPSSATPAPGTWECPAGYEWVDATCSGNTAPQFQCWHPQTGQFSPRIDRNTNPPDPNGANYLSFVCKGKDCAGSERMCPNGYAFSPMTNTCVHKQTGHSNGLLDGSNFNAIYEFDAYGKTLDPTLGPYKWRLGGGLGPIFKERNKDCSTARAAAGGRAAKKIAPKRGAAKSGSRPAAKAKATPKAKARKQR